MRAVCPFWLCALLATACMATPEPDPELTVPPPASGTNQRPVATNDHVTTREGQPVVVAILVNDRDPNGNALTLVGLGQPGHGKATANRNSSVTYTPDPGYAGNDAFTYTIRNAGGQSATSTVAVTVLGKHPNIRITPLLGLELSEGGGHATVTMVLDARPTADVVIALHSSDERLGTVSPARVVFTRETWADPQTITATGLDDHVAEGDRAFSIVTAPAVSVDLRYDGMDAPDVVVTRVDDDHAGFAVTPTVGLVTTEAGGTATFSVRLTSQPSADVRFELDSSNPAEGTVWPNALIFTPGNWNVSQVVTVTGVADGVRDGDKVYSIVSRPAVSADPLYDGYNPPDVTVRNVDVN